MVTIWSIMALKSHIYFIYRKVPYKLSSSRKRGIRERLKNVESILNLLNLTGIKSNALVSDLNSFFIFVI